MGPALAKRAAVAFDETGLRLSKVLPWGEQGHCQVTSGTPARLIGFLGLILNPNGKNLPVEAQLEELPRSGLKRTSRTLITARPPRPCGRQA